MEKTVRHPEFGDIIFASSPRLRRITLSVRPPGRIRLSYPRGVGRRGAEEFLERKTPWLRSTLARLREQWAAAPIADGQRTRERTLVLKPFATNGIRCRMSADTVTVTYPETLSADSDEVQQAARKAVERALIDEGRRILPALTELLALRHGLQFRSVSVRRARTRWGSCSFRNDISLNAYLLLLPDRLVEYVIVHELCHTVHKDHSARFHAMADRLLGGMEKTLRAELRTHRPGL